MASFRIEVYRGHKWRWDSNTDQGLSDVSLKRAEKEAAGPVWPWRAGCGSHWCFKQQLTPNSLHELSVCSLCQKLCLISRPLYILHILRHSNGRGSNSQVTLNFKLLVILVTQAQLWYLKLNRKKKKNFFWSTNHRVFVEISLSRSHGRSLFRCGWSAALL